MERTIDFLAHTFENPALAHSRGRIVGDDIRRDWRGLCVHRLCGTSLRNNQRFPIYFFSKKREKKKENRKKKKKKEGGWDT
jgi:hypothetical protein